MRVEKGDMAFVVRPLKSAPEALGMVVEVLAVEAAFPFPTGPKPGAYIRASQSLRRLNGTMGTSGWCKQESLRPIRDPGDDAQDETLSWLPVPSTEKEAA